jgi:hypothetical protein
MNQNQQDLAGDLIRYNNENEYLEFKLVEYRGEIRGNLIKDVIALANSNHMGDRYIIIGIKKHPHEIEFNAIENPEDSAGIQQYIHKNITPELKVTYEPFIYEGHKLALLTICDPVDQPYFSIKDINNSKTRLIGESAIFIKKGSYQVLPGRADFDRIYRKKYAAAGLEGKLELSSQNGSREIQIPCIRDIRLPSDVQKDEIENEIHFKEQLRGPDFLAYVENAKLNEPAGYKGMAVPELRERLRTVKMNFQSEDVYYINENRAFKLNLELLNNGTQFLEKALVVLTIPGVDGLTVVERIPFTTYQQAVPAFAPEYDYPSVKNAGGRVMVTREIGEVRHGMKTQVFNDALRIVAVEKLAGTMVPVIAQVFGANLFKPQEFELLMRFV